MPVEAAFPSEATKFGKDWKLSLPAKILKALGWVTKKDEALDLVIELFKPGHLKIFLAIAKETDIKEEARLLRVEEPLSDYAIQRLQVLSDRFRSISLVPSDGRIRLSEPILLFLGIDPSTADNSWVFLQAGQTCIDVMSIEERNKRLREI